MPDAHLQTSWTHFNPVKIVKVKSIFEQLPTFITKKTKILFVTTAGFTRRGLTEKVIKCFDGSQVVLYDQVTPNPDLDNLDTLTQKFRGENISSIVALGGGSVMDVAKVLSVTLPSEFGKPLDQALRVSETQHKHTWQIHHPVITIPTTSGTGAEVTPFATVWDNTKYKKHSVASDLLYPTVAILNPELTITLPYKETLYTGLDAISQALESLWNKNRTPISESYAFQSLSLACKALPIVLHEPTNLLQRSKMQQASLLAGLAISHTRTAIAHSISYPLTSHFGVPHGLACSFTLPEILRSNLDSLVEVTYQRLLLADVLELLKSLKLNEHLANYTTIQEIMALQTKMETKGRADNFIFEFNLEKLLSKSCLPTK